MDTEVSVAPQEMWLHLLYKKTPWLCIVRSQTKQAAYGYIVQFCWPVSHRREG